MKAKETQSPVIFLGSSLTLPNLIDSLHAQNRCIIGIWDQDYQNQRSMFELPILKEDFLDQINVQEYEFFVATNWNPGKHPITVRNNQKRNDLIDLMKKKNLTGAKIIHPTAIVSPRAEIGCNVSIGAMTMVTHGTKIHNHVSIKEQCYISHDVVIEEDSVIQIKACITGDVHIGKHTYVGINSTIINRGAVAKPMRIGNNSLIHPTVLVMQDLPDDSVASLQDSKFSRVF